MLLQPAAILLSLVPAWSGPDAVMSDLAAPARMAASTPPGSIAYAVGGNTCNLGDAPLPFSPVNAGVHPIFAQNLYRLRNGRIEQIGLSWAFHEFCPLQESNCATCIPVQSPCAALGPGCSSFDTSNLAGSTLALGPRSEVDAAAGTYVYPNSTPAPGFPGGRMLVHNDDLNPAINPGATYFSELVVVSPADAAAGNSTNNASHRQVIPTTFTDGGWNIVNAGSSQFDGQPAVLALARLSPPGSTRTATLDIEGDGRVYVVSTAWYEGPRSWRYEYAVFNLSSDRAIGQFSVPIVPNLFIDVTGTDFRGVTHHSGEVWSSTPWSVSHIVGDATDHWVWSTESFTTNPNANAIRWGTLYNFTLYADSPPAEGHVRLGLFKPGEVGDVFADAFVPSQACPADFDHNAVHEVPDIFAFLAAWFAGETTADVDGVPGLGVPDIFAFLASWFAGCP